jgi:hypothetical protein
MRRALRTTLTTTAIGLTTVAALSAAVKFTSTFKSLDAGATRFAGKKVAALVISNDVGMRVPAEEALVRELNARGMQGVATYKIVPKEELNRAETARPWFEKSGVEGIVAIRPVSTETRMAYTSGTWVSANYGTLWDYYGYGWGSVYIPPSAQRETVVVVETTIFSVSRNQLLWAAVTESTNPRDLKAFVEELAKQTVKEMQKQGLAKSQKK